MDKLQLEELIFNTVIDKAGAFNYNDIYQISWDINCDFDLVKNTLDSFLKKGIITKLYYNPYENATADVPIGKDSYEIFLVKNESINIHELMK